MSVYDYESELVMFCNPEILKVDKYQQQIAKRLYLSIKKIFGLFDAEVEKYHTDADKYMLVQNIVHNIYLRSSFFDLPKEEFLKICELEYDRHFNCKKI